MAGRWNIFRFKWIIHWPLDTKTTIVVHIYSKTTYWLICLLNELLVHVFGVKNILWCKDLWWWNCLNEKSRNLKCTNRCQFNTVKNEAGFYKIIFNSLWYGTLILHLFAEDHRCYCVVLEWTTPADDRDTENETSDNNDAENEIVDDTYTKMQTVDYIPILKIELRKTFVLKLILLMVLIQMIELLMKVMLKIWLLITTMPKIELFIIPFLKT